MKNGLTIIKLTSMGSGLDGKWYHSFLWSMWSFFNFIYKFLLYLFLLFLSFFLAYWNYFQTAVYGHLQFHLGYFFLPYVCG